MSYQYKRKNFYEEKNGKYRNSSKKLILPSIMFITNDSFLKLRVTVFGLILSPIVTKVGYLIVAGVEKLTRLFEKRNVLTQKTTLEVNK